MGRERQIVAVPTLDGSAPRAGDALNYDRKAGPSRAGRAGHARASHAVAGALGRSGAVPERRRRQAWAFCAGAAAFARFDADL